MAHDHDHHHGASHDAPIVCNLNAFTPEQKRRHGALSKKLHGSVTSTRELDAGFALKLSNTKITVPEAGEWMLLEFKCCPFLEIALEPDAGALWLRLTGRAGVKEFLRGELGL
jgi:hypothetical protein